MEKNHTLFENFESTKNKMIPCSTNLIFYNDAFSKTKFMSKIMESFEDPIIYLDFDLLFSGYLESGHIEKPPNMEIIKPDKENLKELLPSVLTKISSRKTTLIVDSLNGLYNFIDDDNPARFVTSLIMLLTTNAKFAKSILFVITSSIEIELRKKRICLVSLFHKLCVRHLLFGFLGIQP